MPFSFRERDAAIAALRDGSVDVLILGGERRGVGAGAHRLRLEAERGTPTYPGHCTALGSDV